MHSPWAYPQAPMRSRAAMRTTRDSRSAPGKSKCWADTPARCSCWAWRVTWASSPWRGWWSRRRYDSTRRFPIAVIGLGVNVLSAWLLSTGSHQHDHHHAAGGHDHAHVPRDHHHDLNLRSAYLHVLADAATSVFAIAALIGGRYFGASWLDPVMGIVGTLLVGRWALGLLRDTGRVLLDAEMDAPVVAEVREAVDGLTEPARLRDLHVWRVGKGKYACIVSIETDARIRGNRGAPPPRGARRTGARDHRGRAGGLNAGVARPAPGPGAAAPAEGLRRPQGPVQRRQVIEAWQMLSIDASSAASNSASDCWAERPSVSAREKLATMPCWRASRALASSRE